MKHPRYNSRVPEITDRAEPFTDVERARLAPFFTNLDGHVFALTNLPETVKGALFARYSRSPKSLRRLFLDEFVDQLPAAMPRAEEVGVARAAQLITLCRERIASTRLDVERVVAGLDETDDA